MKSTITILTLFVAAIAIAPRPSYGQYAWVPVYTDEAVADAYNSAPGQSGYATYIDEDLEDFGDKQGDCDAGGKAGGKAGCKCSLCRNGWLNRAFGGIEYLHWYQKGSRLPPLFSQGPQGVGFQNPGTRLLFGGNFVGHDLMAGMRLTGGLWLDDCKSRAVVIRAFGSEGASTPFGMNAPNAGFPFYGIPFFNVVPLPGAEDGFQVAEPGRAGTVSAQASNDVFGGDALYKALLNEGCDYRFDLLAGYQYSKIDDDLVVGTISAGGGRVPPFATNDVFNVSNEFNAATIGLSGDFNQGPVTVQLMGKLGFGNMKQSVGISGNHVLAGVPGPGGFFAQPPNNGAPFNIGERNRDVFTLSPEASAKMIWCLKDNFSISVGYTFLYWNHVAMAGDQIDRRTLNSTGSVNRTVLFDGAFAGGGANPAFVFRDTDFFVHTIDIGALFKY